MIKSKLLSFTSLLSFLLLIALTLIISSCGRSSNGDLTTYLEKIRKEIFSIPRKSTMSDFLIPKPATYTSASLRSPFEESSTTVAVTRNPDSPLTGYMVSSLRFVGTIIQDKKMWGIILTPTNKVYKVTMGDHIGNQNGKIVHIYRDRIEVTEWVNDGKAPASQRLVTLQLKEKD